MVLSAPKVRCKTLRKTLQGCYVPSEAGPAGRRPATAGPTRPAGRTGATRSPDRPRSGTGEALPRGQLATYATAFQDKSMVQAGRTWLASSGRARYAPDEGESS